MGREEGGKEDSETGDEGWSHPCEGGTEGRACHLWLVNPDSAPFWLSGGGGLVTKSCPTLVTPMDCSLLLFSRQGY